MKFSKITRKKLDQLALMNQHHEGTMLYSYLEILEAVYEKYKDFLPSDDWRNINDEWEKKWNHKTYIKDKFKTVDINLLDSLHDLKDKMYDSLYSFAPETDFPDLFPDGSVTYGLREGDPDLVRLENEINLYEYKLRQAEHAILTSDESKIINNIKKNKFKSSFTFHNNVVKDRSKYDYHLGKINDFLIDYCKNNNINIVFIGTASESFFGLGRYKRFGVDGLAKKNNTYRLKPRSIISEIQYIIYKYNESGWDTTSLKNHINNMKKPFLEQDAEGYTLYSSDNYFEPHIYSNFDDTYFDYINSIWGDRIPDYMSVKKSYNDIKMDTINAYFRHEMGLHIQSENEPPAPESDSFDIEINESIVEPIFAQNKFDEPPIFTRKEFLNEHKNLNQMYCEYIKIISENKYITPITYTCNMGVNGAELNLDNLDKLFRYNILDKSKTLLVVENNGFKDFSIDSFEKKLKNYPLSLIFDTSDIGSDFIKIKTQIKSINEQGITLTTLNMPLYNYFLPILNVLLELSPFTKNIDINSSFLNNKVIKNIVTTQLINLNSENIDPNPVDINSIQNFERNFNSAIYILRSSGYIKMKGNFVITIDAIKKLRKFIKKPNIFPIIIIHSNKRTKYLIGETAYRSTSDKIGDKLKKDQIEDFKTLRSNTSGKTDHDDHVDQSIVNFIKSFSELNKIITLPGEKEIINSNVNYVNNSMAILEINNDN